MNVLTKVLFAVESIYALLHLLLFFNIFIFFSFLEIHWILFNVIYTKFVLKTSYRLRLNLFQNRILNNLIRNMYSKT